MSNRRGGWESNGLPRIELLSFGATRINFVNKQGFGWNDRETHTEREKE